MYPFCHTFLHVSIPLFHTTGAGGWPDQHFTTTTNRGVDADLPAECRPAAKHGHPGWDRHCPLVPHCRGGSIVHIPAETSSWTACIHHLNQSCQPAGEAAAGVHHRPAAPVSQQSPTSEDDCLRHSWHREVLPHPLPLTSPAGPAAGCSSHWCGRLQHRWPDPPPLPPQPPHQSRVQGPGGRETQQAFSQVKYLIIDEMSMVGRKIFGQVDRRLRQAFPHHFQEVFRGCSCLLFGDFGQLPPVMDLPLYTTDSRSELSDQGRTAYQTFHQAVVLDQVMWQAGQDPEQVKFRDILLRLRDAKVTLSDWNHLMTRTPTRVQDLSPFLLCPPPHPNC